jgi:hypothetical protein
MLVAMGYRITIHGATIECDSAHEALALAQLLPPTGPETLEGLRRIKLQVERVNSDALQIQDRRWNEAAAAESEAPSPDPEPRPAEPLPDAPKPKPRKSVIFDEPEADDPSPRRSTTPEDEQMAAKIRKVLAREGALGIHAIALSVGEPNRVVKELLRARPDLFRLHPRAGGWELVQS